MDRRETRGFSFKC